MISFKVVEPKFVNVIWDKVEPLLNSALVRHSDAINIDQLRVLLTQGKEILAIGIDEFGIISSAFAINLLVYPNYTVAFTTALGGKTSKELYEQYSEWARQQGASRIQGLAPESVGRLWRRAYGFSQKLILMEKEI